MLDYELAAAACKARLQTLVVATTGSATLAATSSGYSRTLTGVPGEPTFITDGFCVGMELTPAGFPTNAVDVIEAVTATLITTKNTHGVSGASAGRSLSVRLPSMQQYDNDDVTPAINRPWVSAEFSPSTNTTLTLNAQYGRAEETGEYYVTFYGRAGTGPNELQRYAKAALALFASGTTLFAGSDAFRVRWRPGPTAGAISKGDPGFAYCQLVIHWTAAVVNTVAA